MLFRSDEFHSHDKQHFTVNKHSRLQRIRNQPDSLPAAINFLHILNQRSTARLPANHLSTNQLISRHPTRCKISCTQIHTSVPSPISLTQPQKVLLRRINSSIHSKHHVRQPANRILSRPMLVYVGLQLCLIRSCPICCPVNSQV